MKHGLESYQMSALHNYTIFLLRFNDMMEALNNNFQGSKPKVSSYWFFVINDVIPQNVFFIIYGFLKATTINLVRQF
jgi:hypothetical protein